MFKQVNEVAQVPFFVNFEHILHLLLPFLLLTLSMHLFSRTEHETW